MADDKFSDPLGVLDAQHGQINEWLEQMRAAVTFLYGETRHVDVEGLIAYYRGQVVPHFRYEERVLFPAILDVCGTPELERELDAFVAEHRELLPRLRTLVELLSELATGELEEWDADRAVRQARLLIDTLLVHAAREDDLLQPLIERHHSALQLALERSGGGG